MERDRPKELRDLYQRIRCFAQFLTANEFDSFFYGLAGTIPWNIRFWMWDFNWIVMAGRLVEKILKKRITQLQNYRRHGIRTFADAALYESEKNQLVGHR